MYDFKIAAGDTATLYRDLASALEGLTAGEPDGIANMANAAALIWESLPDINWAGFYRNVGGELLITARRFRTQDANRSDARARLAQMIAAAHIAPVKRKATRPSRAAKAQRVEQKRQRSQVKQARGRVDFD